jgi:hypothetical protein
MPTAFNKQLEEMIATLRHWNSWLVAHGQNESAYFLDMARLELQLVRNNISDAELRALCQALAGSTGDGRIEAVRDVTAVPRAENKRAMRLAVAQNQLRKH